MLNTLWTDTSIIVYYLIMNRYLYRLLIVFGTTAVSTSVLAAMQTVTLAQNEMPKFQISLASLSSPLLDQIQSKPAKKQQQEPTSKKTASTTVKKTKPVGVKKVAVRSRMEMPKPAKPAQRRLQDMQASKKESTLHTILKAPAESGASSQNATTTYAIVSPTPLAQVEPTAIEAPKVEPKTMATNKKHAFGKNVALKKGFSFMGVVVDESRFSDLVGLFNSFEIQLDASKQDDLAVSMCYRSNDGTFLEFDTDEESEQDNKTINGITLTKMKGMIPDTRCEDTTRFTEKMKFKNGLHLGMEKETILERLGIPEDIGNHKFIYSYSDDMYVELEFDPEDKVEAISLFKSAQQVT